MSLLFAKFLQTAAKTANAGVHGYVQHRAPRKRRKRKSKPGCTPCEAMARREAARRAVYGHGRD